jgi:hypothetical protein
MDLLERYNKIKENQTLEGTSVSGGPTNDAPSNTTIKYNAENPYYTTQEGIIRATNGESPLTNSSKITSLDVENSEAGVKQGGMGGPNRTSLSNGSKSSFLDGGNYKILRYPTKAKFINAEEGTEDAGTLSTMTLQQYTPNRTYLEVLADPSLEIEAVVGSSTGDVASGGVPSNIDESIAPKDAAPSVDKIKDFNI